MNVSPDRKVYKVREKAKVRIRVKTSDGKPPPQRSEVALAAVDEGLLELMPNRSWDILAAMMGQRGYEVHTATAQMQVIGKRHYGLKALPPGGWRRKATDPGALRYPPPLEGAGRVGCQWGGMDRNPAQRFPYQFPHRGRGPGWHGPLWHGFSIDSIDPRPDDPFRAPPPRQRRGSIQGGVHPAQYRESRDGTRCLSTGRWYFRAFETDGPFLAAWGSEGNRVGCRPYLSALKNSVGQWR